MLVTLDRHPADPHLPAALESLAEVEGWPRCVAASAAGVRYEWRVTAALPDRFVRVITDLHGNSGTAWLAGLPGLLARCEERWSARIGPPFELSYNYVAPARTADATTVVFKLAPPADRDLRTEAAALRLAAGRGSVRLLDADLDLGVLVLEHAEPGTLLTELTADADEAATSAAAAVMRRLWRPVPAHHPFPTVEDWGKDFAILRAAHDGGTGPIPAELLDPAERIYAELRASAEPPVILHGDLHHDNILAAEREPWLAIDPKGLIGEPAYEVGALLRNPYPQLFDHPDPGRVLARRLDQFADELDMDRERLRAWSFSQAVLASIASWEDHGEPWLFAHRCAELLATA